jgi:amidase
MTKTIEPRVSSGALTDWTATELSTALQSGDLSAVEVMTAHLDRIDELNPAINAIVSLQPREQSLAAAAEADSRRLRGEPVGPLHGMPIAVKDLSDAAGFRTTLGSRAFADAAPAEHDVPFVKRMRAAGAIVIGKTNTAEYGVGALALNDVFGATRNPYDLTRHSGGSTGGAAAIASGMLPFSDGSDSGGSIRVPTALSNVVGLRTTIGVVAGKGHANCWDPHAVQGPVARNSRDAALLLSAMSGSDPENPSSWGHEPTAPLGPEGWGDAPVRLAWSDDLGGVPVSKEIRAVMEKSRAELEGHGFDIVDIDLNLSEGDFAWGVIEKFDLLGWGGPNVFEHSELYGEDMVRNVREAQAFSLGQIGYAKHLRYTLYQRMALALEGFDGLVCPATPVAAPPIDATSVWEIDDVKLERYYDWQALSTRLAMTAHPVLVTGAGFTPGGLPVGMQIAGPMGSDRRLLALGDLIESLTPWNAVRPAL